jgi:hypothetical protein
VDAIEGGMELPDPALQRELQPDGPRGGPQERQQTSGPGEGVGVFES